MNRRPYPGYVARHRPAPDKAEIRKAWISALGLIDRITAAAIAAGDGIEPEPAHRQIFTMLALTIRDLEGGNFPVGGPCVQACAGGLLLGLRAFLHPATGSQTRTVCAPFLRAGFELLDAEFAKDRADLAQGWRNQTGERED